MYEILPTFAIELVDSLCRDSTDTQYMIMQEISQTYKPLLQLMYHSFSSVFMTNSTPVCSVKKHCESTEPESR